MSYGAEILLCDLRNMLMYEPFCWSFSSNVFDCWEAQLRVSTNLQFRGGEWQLSKGRVFIEICGRQQISSAGHCNCHGVIECFSPCFIRDPTEAVKSHDPYHNRISPFKGKPNKKLSLHSPLSLYDPPTSNRSVLIELSIGKCGSRSKKCGEFSVTVKESVPGSGGRGKCSSKAAYLS